MIMISRNIYITIVILSTSSFINGEEKKYIFNKYVFNAELSTDSKSEIEFSDGNESRDDKYSVKISGELKSWRINELDPLNKYTIIIKSMDGDFGNRVKFPINIGDEVHCYTNESGVRKFSRDKKMVYPDMPITEFDKVLRISTFQKISELKEKNDINNDIARDLLTERIFNDSIVGDLKVIKIPDGDINVDYQTKFSVSICSAKSDNAFITFDKFIYAPMINVEFSGPVLSNIELKEKIQFSGKSSDNIIKSASVNGDNYVKLSIIKIK